jgi:hypothetical protein
MSAALELIQTVKANGGRMRVDGDSLVIAPDVAALPILSELRQHKREIIRLLENRPTVPAHDPAEWRAPFVEWLDSQCALHPRAFGGLVSLHHAFCDWELAQNEVPCTIETFAALLTELGFLMGKIEGTLLVSGLILQEDEALMNASLRTTDGTANGSDARPAREGGQTR